MTRDRLVIFDIDGTLVDSTYHHALAWQRAFALYEIQLPMWRIHRQIGKGGDRLVPDLTDDDVERSHGDALRERQHVLFAELIAEVRPLDGAHELLTNCKQQGWRVALASSGREQEIAHYLRLLDAECLPDAIVSSGDVAMTKPAPDALVRAHQEAGADLDVSRVVVVGDSTWDCEAARRADMTPIGVLTGGISREELHEAGAVAVLATLAELEHAIAGLLPSAGR
ncbi:MAG TPA: HAD family hydrolase [Conexibacter sp.]|nr:HAD family hydrolase [Conexibacter sp.]